MEASYGEAIDMGHKQHFFYHNEVKPEIILEK